MRGRRRDEAKKKGIPAVPCLPVIYAENPITAGNEKIMEKVKRLLEFDEFSFDIIKKYATHNNIYIVMSKHKKT